MAKKGTINFNFAYFKYRMLSVLPYWCNSQDLKWYGWLRFKDWFQRANRGHGVEESVGQGNIVIARVVAGVLRDLQKNATHAPPFIYAQFADDEETGRIRRDVEALEAWRFWLGTRAAWFEWYTSESAIQLNPDMSLAEKKKAIRLYDAQLTHFQREVFPEIAGRFNHLWDLQ